MEEADQLSDRIGIIDQGKVIALDTPEGLKQRIGQSEVVRLEVSGWYDQIDEKLRKLQGVENLSAHDTEVDGVWEVSLQSQNSRAILPGVVETVNHNGTRLLNMNIVKPSLEDVFIHLTGKALRD
jgi:ABC-2 type transport system ATP-binding protein